MNITDQARDILKQLFQEHDAKNIRVLVGVSVMLLSPRPIMVGYSF